MRLRSVRQEKEFGETYRLQIKIEGIPFHADLRNVSGCCLLLNHIRRIHRTSERFPKEEQSLVCLNSWEKSGVQRGDAT